jgi:acetyl esterase/lipase
MRRRPLSVVLVLSGLLLTIACSTVARAPGLQAAAAASPGGAGAGGDLYQPPDPLPDGPPGMVLGQVPVPVLGGARAWRVLYRSTAVNGRPVAVSGLVVQPVGAPPAGGWPVVSWAHGTTGSADICAPSLIGPASIPPLAGLLASGYVVAATDYEGLGTPGPHPYLDGVSEGRSVLDAARAARQLVPAATGKVLAWGHSQGGQAALWAGELARSYAPDLDVAGIVGFAPGTRLDGLLDPPRSPLLAGFAVAGFAGLKVTHPELRLEDVLSQGALDRLGILEVACIPQVLATFAVVPGGILRSPLGDVPDWRAVLAADDAGETASPAPVLVLQGSADDLVLPETTNLYASHACANGTLVDLRTYPGVDHSAIVVAAGLDALNWSADRLVGRQPTSTC